MAAIVVIAASWLVSWALTCGRLEEVSPSGRCEADTPLTFVRALRARSHLDHSSPRIVLSAARELLEIDPTLDGWGRDAFHAVRQLARDPKDAAFVVDTAKELPVAERTELANGFIADAIAQVLGPERAVELGLEVARTPQLLVAKGALLTNLGLPGEAIALFEEALVSDDNARYRAYWGYALKAHGIKTANAELAYRGHVAMASAIGSLDGGEATAHRRALSWPIPAPSR